MAKPWEVGAKNGLFLKTLIRYWKDKFSPPTIDKKAFVEIIDAEEKTLGVTIRYKDFAIQIHEKFDEKTLSRCLAVIRGVRY